MFIGEINKRAGRITPWSMNEKTTSLIDQDNVLMSVYIARRAGQGLSWTKEPDLGRGQDYLSNMSVWRYSALFNTVCMEIYDPT